MDSAGPADVSRTVLDLGTQAADMFDGVDIGALPDYCAAFFEPPQQPEPPGQTQWLPCASGGTPVAATVPPVGAPCPPDLVGYLSDATLLAVQSRSPEPPESIPSPSEYMVLQPLEAHPWDNPVRPFARSQLPRIQWVDQHWPMADEDDNPMPQYEGDWGTQRSDRHVYVHTTFPQRQQRNNKQNPKPVKAHTVPELALCASHGTPPFNPVAPPIPARPKWNANVAVPYRFPCLHTSLGDDTGRSQASLDEELKNQWLAERQRLPTPQPNF